MDLRFQIAKSRWVVVGLSSVVADPVRLRQNPWGELRIDSLHGCIC